MLNFSRSILIFGFAQFSAESLFKKAFHRVIRAPKYFYDETPVGRFLSRFSKDQEIADTMMGLLLAQVLGSGFSLLGVIVIILVSVWYFVFVLIPIAIVYIGIQQIYSRSTREIKRLESNSRSPLYSHFSESLTGLSTIRAYKKQQEFIRVDQDHLDNYTRCSFLMYVSQRWLSFRLEVLASIIIFGTEVFMCLFKDSFDPNIAGLSLTYALQITSSIGFFVQQYNFHHN